MGRKRYRVALVVLSNMDGDPPEGQEEKMIKDYLEGINGVGIIEVQEVQRLAHTLPAPPSEDEIRPTVPSPPPDNMQSNVFKPEPATRSRKRKRP